jgi:hypothetical protein
MLFLEHQLDMLHAGRGKHIFHDQPVRDVLPLTLELVVVSGRRHDDQAECGKHEGALAAVAGRIEGLDRRSLGGKSWDPPLVPVPEVLRCRVFPQTLIDPRSRQDLAPVPLAPIQVQIAKLRQSTGRSRRPDAARGSPLACRRHSKRSIPNGANSRSCANATRFLPVA